MACTVEYNFYFPELFFISINIIIIVIIAIISIIIIVLEIDKLPTNFKYCSMFGALLHVFLFFLRAVYLIITESKKKLEIINQMQKLILLNISGNSLIQLISSISRSISEFDTSNPILFKFKFSV